MSESTTWTVSAPSETDLFFLRFDFLIRVGLLLGCALLGRSLLLRLGFLLLALYEMGLRSGQSRSEKRRTTLQALTSSASLSSFFALDLTGFFFWAVFLGLA